MVLVDTGIVKVNQEALIFLFKLSNKYLFATSLYYLLKIE